MNDLPLSAGVWRNWFTSHWATYSLKKNLLMRFSQDICEQVVVPNANFFPVAGVLPSVKYIVYFKAEINEQGPHYRSLVVKVEGMFFGRDPLTVTHHNHDVVQRDF